MGIYVDRKRYDAETKQLALCAIDRLRPCVYLPVETETGARFNNNERVFDLLESATPQAAFLEFPMRFVEKALLEAAQSDWWYNHEKDYSDDPELDISAENDNDY